ncbi:MAG: hypothetical protein M3Q07_01845 [Pseudobdellovibrionaceae bacterium]|nr:hypothetical protein [Pseudobdellovibrionaceae bacterium]
MKKLPLLLLGLIGTAVATFFYFDAKDEPATGRPPMTQKSSPNSEIASKPKSVETDPVKASDQLSSGSQQQPEAPGEEDTVNNLADFKRARATTVANQLSTDLDEILFAKGFTQAEIDVTTKYIGDAFLNARESVELSTAIDATAAALKLDSARKEALTSGVFSAVTKSTGKYTYSEYQTCVNLRTAEASDCVKDLAQELAQKVAAKSEADVLNAQAIYSLEPEGKAAAKKAVELCGENSEKAEAYFKVNLAGCI